MIADFINVNRIYFDIIGFFASIFTIISFLRWIFQKDKSIYKLGVLNFIILSIKKFFAHVFKGGNEEKAKQLQKYISLNKLYSGNALKQSIAIREIIEFGDIEWAFNIFVERVGNKPELSSENKDAIMREIVKLCKMMA